MCWIPPSSFLISHSYFSTRWGLGKDRRLLPFLLSVNLQFRNAKSWESSLKFKWLRRQATKGHFVFSKVSTWLFPFLEVSKPDSREFTNTPTLPWRWCCSSAPPSSSCYRSWRTFPPSYSIFLCKATICETFSWLPCCPSQLFWLHAAAATCDSS